MLRYAPDVALRVKPGGADRLVIEEGGKPTDPYIVFDPREGLTTLLHELGHWATRKQAEECKSVIEEEAIAWGWAEKTARRENLWFDYRKADEKFGSYAEQHNVPLRMIWTRV